MSRRTSSFIVAMVVSVAATAFAQAPKTPPRRVVADTPAFANLSTAQTMARAEEKLQRLEAATMRVRMQKSVSAEDTDAIRDNLADYGKSLMAAGEKAHADTQAAADSKGTRGNSKAIVDLESMAKDHAARLTKMKTDSEDIEQGLQQGRIKPTKSFLDRVTGPERAKFKDFLTPDARQDVEKTAPGYFNGASSSLPSPHEVMIALEKSTRGVSQYVNHMDFSLEPEAQASAWAPCVAICYVGDVIDCAICSAAAAWQSYNAYLDYQTCMASVGWWNWWVGLWCTLDFAVRVA
jgi:hypothetical protein